MQLAQMRGSEDAHRLERGEHRRGAAHVRFHPGHPALPFDL
jgi:hypothetical protein